MAYRTQNPDRLAVVLSTTCVAHCLILPVLALSLPAFSAFAENELVHWVLATLAIMTSTFVAVTSPSARIPNFLLPAGFGASL
ncbi:MAG: MerC domain-containing protein, partial [Pseudomonadota bacterium]